MRGFKRTISVDADNPVPGDFHLTNGDTTEATDENALISEIRSRLLFVRGTSFTDLREGVPYLTEILIKGYGVARVKALLRRTILSHPLVVDVPRLELTVDRASRAASVSFEARTNNGLVVKSEDFGPLIIAD